MENVTKKIKCKFVISNIIKNQIKNIVFSIFPPIILHHFFCIMYEEDETISEEFEEIKTIFKIFEKNKLNSNFQFEAVDYPRTYFDVCVDLKVNFELN